MSHQINFRNGVLDFINGGRKRVVVPEMSKERSERIAALEKELSNPQKGSVHEQVIGVIERVYR